MWFALTLAHGLRYTCMQATVLVQNEKHMLNNTTIQESAAESSAESHEATQQESTTTNASSGKQSKRNQHDKAHGRVPNPAQR